MKRLCGGNGDGVWGGRSIHDLPEELLENILWRMRKGSQAAACGMVCRIWGRIIRKCPALALHFDLLGKVEAVWIPRIEAIIGGMLMHRPHLRELSIVVKQRMTRKLVLSEDRLVNWFLPLAPRVETLRIRVKGFNLTKCLKMPRLKKLLVSHASLRKMPLAIREQTGKNLRFCCLDSVVFYSSLNELLSACPCLESLILNDCRVSSCLTTAISCPSLRRLFIVNTYWFWIFLDAPELELLAIKSRVRKHELLITASRQTRIERLILVSPIRLGCRARAVYLAGDEWGLPFTELPAVKLPLGIPFSGMSDEAMEEMDAWLGKFGKDLRLFGSRAIEATPTWKHLQENASVVFQLF